MSKAAWYPKAKRLDQGTTGGTMVGGKAHATLHTTETKGWAGAAYYHIVFNEVAPGLVEVRQYRPFNKAARSLRNKAGGVQTNRQGTVHIQPSVVGYAKDAPHRGAFTDAMYRALHDFAVWCEAEWGVPLAANPPKTGGGECYGEYSPCRFSNRAWVVYSGWAEHQNAPENTHWDSGPVDWPMLLQGTDLPTEEDEDMFCAKGDTGAKVEYWQRRILRIDPGALPRYGADADYGDETATAVAKLVPESDGLQIGPLEAEALDALISGNNVDLDGYATKADLQRYVLKGTTITVI